MYIGNYLDPQTTDLAPRVVVTREGSAPLYFVRQEDGGYVFSHDAARAWIFYGSNIAHQTATAIGKGWLVERLS